MREAGGNTTGKQALAGAGRADQYQVFSSEHRKQREANDLAPFYQSMVECIQYGIQALFHGYAVD
ncbi:hypothetical protein GCM10011419_16480 [Vogesella fluminis]|uniref:Uncharacterized protein n=1 Tax=Vogesella fluminis TaxID=1069161 RepID=A0ABQ3HDJ6_9NEIS|nr:hypothetical protein GCM10011419_16480 [Vogesella fluminis]